MNQESLTITEIYSSIQGESSYAGLPCTFIRLTGCPLRCSWCDTVYGFKGGQVRTFPEIMAEVKTLGLPLVELTGGEPLAQPQVCHLMQQLIGDGYTVLLETSGSEPIKDVPRGVHVIMDIKCPGSGMEERNLWDNLEWLKPSDEIKFVIRHRDDYEWALSKIEQFRLTERSRLLMSCAFGLLEPRQLAEWMVADKLKARLNLQQHKYIWSPRARGV